MFRMISTTALALALAGPAFADAHAANPSMAEMTDEESAQLIRTRDITGGPIYSVSEGYEEESWMGDDVESAYSNDTMGYGNDLRQIGEIEDIILDRSGQMIGIVAEVGGFLDIGDKHVMLRVDDVRLVPVDDATYSFVTRMSEEQLEEMPSVNEGWWN
ncbi:PRC-barrel domain protein [Jannaschia donghaensis]|uniref:PRC-barrel domain protein n=2 Tax=Jannaschia donghaensis TaxID=420998 RepID=A0A0M6YLC5_9RHOB|nr:PRC-barrel domain protein [Jannaschia donghaensis]